MFPFKGGGENLRFKPRNQRFPWGKLTNTPPKTTSLNERARKKQASPSKKDPLAVPTTTQRPGKKKTPEPASLPKDGPDWSFFNGLMGPPSNGGIINEKLGMCRCPILEGGFLGESYTVRKITDSLSRRKNSNLNEETTSL